VLSLTSQNLSLQQVHQVVCQAVWEWITKSKLKSEKIKVKGPGDSGAFAF
jgi:hypothetical protein